MNPKEKKNENKHRMITVVLNPGGWALTKPGVSPEVVANQTKHEGAKKREAHRSCHNRWKVQENYCAGRELGSISLG